MFASVLIIVLCSALLGYWFRYSCILLLQNSLEQVSDVSAAMQGTFSSAEIQNGLASGAALDCVLELERRIGRRPRGVAAGAPGESVSSGREAA